MRESGAFFSLEGPLEPGPIERQMRAANISGFRALVQQYGGDPRRILERHGIEPAAMSDPDQYIDRTSFVGTLEYCSTFFNDPLFGLRLAETQQADIYGCVTALSRAAPHVREGLHAFIDYFPVAHSQEGSSEIAIQGNMAELRWCAPHEFDMSEQALYQGLLLEIKIIQMLSRQPFRPSYVHLAAAVRRKDLETIEQKLGCRVSINPGTNADGLRIGYAVAFPAPMLDWPVPSSNKLTYTLLKSYLDRMKIASNVTVEERVEAYIRGALASGDCTIERCAKRLGIAVRTLQQHLTKSGLQFSSMLEAQRIECAKQYLRNSDSPLCDVASMLGYSEQTSFCRAFRRWTGTTPHAFRANREVAAS
jgi:AraC-like DNA-binding protein